MAQETRLRWTNCGKWDRPWFRETTDHEKLIYLFIRDDCDTAGIWEVDPARVRFAFGWDLKLRDFLKACNGHVNLLPDDKPVERVRVLDASHIWIVHFCLEQYRGGIKESNRAHRPVIASLLQWNLLKEVVEQFTKRNIACEIDGDGEGKGAHSEVAARVLTYLNEKAKHDFKPTALTLKPIVSRLKAKFTEIDCRMAIDDRCRLWLKDASMKTYLRPSTLFRPAKFEEYLAEARRRGTPPESKRAF